MELGKTSYVILGMLAHGARSGYDIKAKADVSTRFFWAISYGQIYPELKRLEDAGLIEGEEDPAGGRRRNAYSLTPAGRDALRDWIASDTPLQRELRHEGILRLFFADAAEPADRVALLRRMRAEHERVRDELEAIRPAAERLVEEAGAECPLLTLETGIAYEQFFVDLCDRLEGRLDRSQSTIGGS